MGVRSMHSVCRVALGALVLADDRSAVPLMLASAPWLALVAERVWLMALPPQGWAETQGLTRWAGDMVPLVSGFDLLSTG